MSEKGSLAELHTAMDAPMESGRFRKVFRSRCMGPRRASLPNLSIAPPLNLLKVRLKSCSNVVV